MKKLAIVGASGHGKVVADLAQLCGWEVSFFDDKEAAGTAVSAWRVIGGTSELMSAVKEFDGFVVAIGDNRVRSDFFELLVKNGGVPPVLIHPKACVSSHARIGQGTVIMAGAVVNVDAEIGRNCIINTGATVDHDCLLSDGVHVSPGANIAGGVIVGTQSWVGIGAVIKQKITIGKFSVVGAAAAVIYDVADNSVVGGVPAVQLR